MVLDFEGANDVLELGAVFEAAVLRIGGFEASRAEIMQHESEQSSNVLGVQTDVVALSVDAAGSQHLR